MSNKEQLIWLNGLIIVSFQPTLEFICICDVDDTTADTIVYYPKDTILYMNVQYACIELNVMTGHQI